MALGSRLRRLGECFGNEAKQVYSMYGVELDVRWFPVFYMLTQQDQLAITQLAEDVGQTHPAVSQVVREMQKQEIVEANKCAEDARINRVSLTAKGRKIAEQVYQQSEDTDEVVQELLQAAGVDLWTALQAVEDELERHSFFERMKLKRQQREQQSIRIVPFQTKYQQAFKQLNCEWIEPFFELEESDRIALDDPQGHIIDPGGYIALAISGDEILGCCALIPITTSHGNHAGSQNQCYELAKMAVTETAQGKGIGYRIGMHILAHAKKLGASSVYLESNTQLTPAITLYKKLGFKRSVGQPSPYARCNIQMEHDLKQLPS